MNQIKTVLLAVLAVVFMVGSGFAVVANSSSSDAITSTASEDLAADINGFLDVVIDNGGASDSDRLVYAVSDSSSNITVVCDFSNFDGTTLNLDYDNASLWFNTYSSVVFTIGSSTYTLVSDSHMSASGIVGFAGALLQKFGQSNISSASDYTLTVGLKTVADAGVTEKTFNGNVVFKVVTTGLSADEYNVVNNMHSLANAVKVSVVNGSLTVSADVSGLSSLSTLVDKVIKDDMTVEEATDYLSENIDSTLKASSDDKWFYDAVTKLMSVGIDNSNPSNLFNSIYFIIPYDSNGDGTTEEYKLAVKDVAIPDDLTIGSLLGAIADGAVTDAASLGTYGNAWSIPVSSFLTSTLNTYVVNATIYVSYDGKLSDNSGSISVLVPSTTEKSEYGKSTVEYSTGTGVAKITTKDSDVVSYLANGKLVSNVSLVGSVATDSLITAVVEQVKAAKASGLTVDTSTVELILPSSSNSVTISSSSLSSLRSVSCGITVTDGDSSIAMDGASVTGMSGSGDLVISIDIGSASEIGLTDAQAQAVGDLKVVSVQVTRGGSAIHYFDGAVTISAKYVLGDGESADNMCFWYVSDAGNVTNIDATYNSGTQILTAELPHLSIYAISPSAYNGGGDDGNGSNWVSILIMGIFCAIIIVILLDMRAKRQ